MPRCFLSSDGFNDAEHLVIGGGGRDGGVVRRR